MFKVNIRSHGSIEVNKGDTYEVLVRKFGEDAVAVRQGNILYELSSPILENGEIELIDVSDPDGEKIYQRSLTFLLIRAVKEVDKKAQVKVSNSLSKGLFCKIKSGKTFFNTDQVEKVKEVMKDLVKRALPIVSVELEMDDAKDIFKKQKMKHKIEILEYRKYSTIRLYEIDGFLDYFYGYMLTNTSMLKHFDLIKYGEGVILQHPTRFVPNGLPKFEESSRIASVFDEMDRWLSILNISYLHNLNEIVKRNEHRELIQVAEALHEKKIVEIADEITRQGKKVILIAGPSSSGKTTFAQRLRIQLRVNGLRPVTMGTDDYFVDRSKTPKDAEGNYDFECLEAVDTELFNRDLNHLLDGDKIQLPTFDFQEGKRKYEGETLRLKHDQPIIIEGIHGLNDALTAAVFRRDKFKVYISALTQLNIDEHNRISTTQSRLIRRMVRDSSYRGHDAIRTIGMWQSVRRGEEKYIFPYQETADATFNSALPYELAILKKHAIPMLKAITPEYEEYQDAIMLIKFLNYVEGIADDSVVPSSSILKEFIGGSSFEA